MKKTQLNLLKMTTVGLSLFLTLGINACTNKESTAESEDAETAVVEADSLNLKNNLFADWDANKDGYLDEEEFDGGLFSAWDTNGDGKLNEDEWNTGMREKGYKAQGWADWDINRDGFLNIGEHHTGSSKSGWHHMWDKDGDNRLSPQEYEEGIKNSKKQ